MENGKPVGEPFRYYGENPTVMYSDNLNYIQNFSEINNVGIIVTFMYWKNGKESSEKEYKIEFVNGEILQQEIIVEF